MKKRKGSSQFTLGKKEKKKPEKLFLGKRLINTFLIIFAAVVLGYGFITFCFQTVYMTGPSMESTISNDDELVMNKLAYKFKDHPGRGDIIVRFHICCCGTSRN